MPVHPSAATQVPFTRFLNVAAKVEIQLKGGTPVIVENLNDDGPYISWKVEDTYKQDPTKCEVALYNLGPTMRGQLQEMASTPPGVPDLVDFNLTLSIGWDGQVMKLFKGRITYLEADRSRKATGSSGQDNRNVVTFFRALDGLPLKEQKEVNSKKESAGYVPLIAVVNCCTILGIRVSPAAQSAITKAASKHALLKFKGRVLGNPKEILNGIFETLRLSWAISEGELLVFERAVNNQALKVSIGPSSGLIGVEIKDDGKAKVTAMANPACEVGGPVDIYGKDGKLVTGATLRVDKIKFEGSTDGKSTMGFTCWKPKALGT